MLIFNNNKGCCAFCVVKAQNNKTLFMRKVKSGKVWLPFRVIQFLLPIFDGYITNKVLQPSK